MGVAMGRVGLSFDDFCKLYHDEFESIATSWNAMAEEAERSRWERMRLAAAIGIQPHLRKKITPRQLVALPWDNEKVQGEQSGSPTQCPIPEPAERLRRFEALTAAPNRENPQASHS